MPSVDETPAHSSTNTEKPQTAPDERIPVDSLLHDFSAGRGDPD
jgi:hypothetical protein